MTPNNQTGALWYADPSQGSIPDPSNLFQEQFLKPLGKTTVNIEREKEGAEYGSARFEIDGQTYLYRQAKHTPKKIGQLVALWKHPAISGEIAPFNYDGGTDRVTILAGEHSCFGAFALPRRLSVEKDISSEKPIGGKRAFRVYTPWVMLPAAQARRAKVWQCDHFVEPMDTAQGLTQLAKVLQTERPFECPKAASHLSDGLNRQARLTKPNILNHLTALLDPVGIYVYQLKFAIL